MILKVHESPVPAYFERIGVFYCVACHVRNWEKKVCENDASRLSAWMFFVLCYMQGDDHVAEQKKTWPYINKCRGYLHICI